MSEYELTQKRIMQLIKAASRAQDPIMQMMWVSKIEQLCEILAMM